LADLNVAAFFDEPTTNMDSPRKNQTSEAFPNIKTFRQLFCLISHDDYL
jgi:exonuclease SbcC